MAGSVIIVTTRNEAVLDQSKFEVDYKYELNELDKVQALLLFNIHAFRMDHSLKEFEGISHDIISNMGELPLALEVVGSYLYKKNQKVWEDVKKKLKNQPHGDVQKILQISYDALEDEQKLIFLDIVCFFIGKTSEYAMYMWEDCGFYPSIEELKVRCLIKIGDHGEFLVHDQLRDLGRSIFCQGQPREKCCGPWDDNYEGVPKVLRMNARRRPAWLPSRSPSRFRKILWRHLSCFRFRDNLRAASSGTSNDELLYEVRWLEWSFVQSDLPLSMHLSNLIVLDLSWSMIREYWQGWRSFMASKRLKVLMLKNCHNLRSTPDLSAFTQLKILILSNCDGLEHLHPSIGKLTSLVSLDLTSCRSLKKLPEEVGELKNLKELLLDYSGVAKIPLSIASLRKLEKLSAYCCVSLREIPSSIGDLQNLQCLDLKDCDKLQSLPELPSSLQHLNLGCCDKLRSLPELPSSLQRLELRGCKELRSQPELPSSLQHLDLRFCDKLRSLPKLPSLQHLDLRGCDELQLLPELPSSLQHVDLSGCNEFGSLPELPLGLSYLWISCQSPRLPQLSRLIHLEKLHLQRCHLLVDIPELSSRLLNLCVEECNKLTSLWLSRLMHLEELSIEKCSSLEVISLRDCNSIERLHCLELLCLKKLTAFGCDNLVEIEGLDGAEFLEELDFIGCKSIKTLPDLMGCEKLRSLRVRDCKKLTQLQGLEKLDSIDLDISGCDSLEATLNLSRTPIFRNYMFPK
ncbi:hypothetical protein ACJRO7_011073 [Eucalyptus globulus]|uniref:NB-ARC domain-containing protein n=1 Tax=Eucalyptus globulus TaxID=34317 RepID=A0ABD3LDZ1_EUCGL